jgi:hypothetical protein
MKKNILPYKNNLENSLEVFENKEKILYIAKFEHIKFEEDKNTSAIVSLEKYILNNKNVPDFEEKFRFLGIPIGQVKINENEKIKEKLIYAIKPKSVMQREGFQINIIHEGTIVGDYLKVLKEEMNLQTIEYDPNLLEELFYSLEIRLRNLTNALYDPKNKK